MLSVEAIDQELAELERQFKQDRDALLAMRAYALRKAGQPAPVSDWSPMSGKIPPTRGGEKTDRQIIREFLAGWTGEFTIQQLMDAAQRHPETREASFDKNLWAATIFWLCRNRFLEVVKPREGNKGGTYRVIVSRTELVSPKRRKNNNQDPLQNTVIEAIAKITTARFVKNDIIKLVREVDPERDTDVIGAVLHRLASNNIGVRIAERSRTGNIYEKL